MRRSLSFIIGLLAVLGMVGFQPAHASASSGSEATATVDVSSLTYGTIDAAAHVKTVAASGVTINGKPVVRYVRNPAKHWNPKRAKKVPFAKNYWAGVRSGKPFRLHRGQKFPDTYIGMAADMTEHDVAVKNKVRHAWQLFDVKNGVVRNRGYWTGKKWVGDCVNPKPSKKPKISINSVVVVKQRGAMKVKIGGDVDLSSMVSGQVAVDCGSSSASARFSALAETTLEGSVWVRARTRQEAILKGSAKLKQQYSQNAELSLQADAVQKLEGSAVATCSGGETPQPVDNPPVVNILGSPAHLYVGGNAAIWIEAFDPDGDAVSVTVSASGAGTVAGLVPSDVRWDNTPCPPGKSCYRATVWAKSTPGTVTITATVKANGKSDTDSVSLPVKPDDF